MLSRSLIRLRPLPVLLWLAVAGCDSQAADLREWNPSDHDHTSKPSQGQVDVAEEAENPLAKMGVSEVALVAWRQNCVRCHGIVGRGDGPQGAMFRPPDLTNADRQAQVTDAELLAVIKNGRGKMPAFDLPEPTLQGLVRLLRLLDASGKGVKAATPAASTSAAPPSSAPAGNPAPAASPPSPASAAAPHPAQPPAPGSAAPPAP